MIHRISRKKYQIFSFDIESHNDEESIAKKETSMWLGCFIDETSQEEDESIYFYNMNDYLDRLEEENVKIYDKITVLEDEIEEIEKLISSAKKRDDKYFASDEARLCKPTPLALDYGVYADEESGTCPWWLRNQGSVAECAALVTEFGAVDYSGDGVYCEGSAVRPAMWINLA